MTKSEMWLRIFLKYADDGWSIDAAGKMADKAVEAAREHLEDGQPEVAATLPAEAESFEPLVNPSPTEPEKWTAPELVSPKAALPSCAEVRSL